MPRQMLHRTIMCKCIDCKMKFEHIYRILKSGKPKRCFLCSQNYKYSLVKLKIKNEHRT